MLPVMQQMFPDQQITPQIAMQMIEKYRGGQSQLAQGKQKQAQETSQVSGGEGVMSSVGGFFGSVGDSLLNMGKMAVDAAHGDFAGAGRAWNADEKQFSVGSYNATADAQNPMLNSIVGQYGPAGIQIVDPNSGNVSKLDGSRAQTEGLAQGKLNWRRAGEQGNGIPLSKTTGMEDKNFNTGGQQQTNVSFNPAQVQIKVDTSTGNATVSPNPVQLTPHSQAVNSGVGDGTMNNPPPGDGYGYYSGRVPGQH
jgi:hypothetical protein